MVMRAGDGAPVNKYRNVSVFLQMARDYLGRYPRCHLVSHTQQIPHRIVIETGKVLSHTAMTGNFTRTQQTPTNFIPA